MAVTWDFYRSSFDGRIRDLIVAAANGVPVFADRLANAGLAPGDLGDAAALDRLPVLTKDELVALQHENPPFGGFLGDGVAVLRIFQSPGPLYEPMLAGPDPWRWRSALEASGFRPGDVVLNAFSYHLSPAGAMFDHAAVELGCVVIPGGVGSSDLQVAACNATGATGYIGLPSYLTALLERAGELGTDLSLQRALVTGEPLPPRLRTQLREDVPVVRQAYGTAETGNLGYECEAEAGLHLPDDAYVQVCDPDTGAISELGETGQVVATLFEPAFPLVRFGTGDLSRIEADPCPCGRTTPRLAGVLGRVGEAVKVRGMFLHPRQVTEAMRELHDVASYRFVVDRTNQRDVLTCRIVVARGAQTETVRGLVRDHVRAALRFDADVEPVSELPDDGRVIEDARAWT